MNRFDLEQEILNCWRVTDDIDLLYRRVMDGPPMTEDDIANFLLGLKTVYNARFEHTWDVFEECIRNKQI